MTSEAQRLADELKAATAIAVRERDDDHSSDDFVIQRIWDQVDKLASMIPAGGLAEEAPAVPEQDPEMLEAMKESNKWHFVDDIVPVLKAARAGRWQWWANSRCKYIELRIDMRDLGCIIRDREKVRISPATLAFQYGDAALSAPTPQQEQPR